MIKQFFGEVFVKLFLGAWICAAIGAVAILAAATFGDVKCK